MFTFIDKAEGERETVKFTSISKEVWGFCCSSVPGHNFKAQESTFWQGST